MKNKFDTIIDVKNSHIEFLQASSSGLNKRIETSRIAVIKESSESELHSIFRSFLSNKNISSDTFTLMLPRRVFIVKHFLLPSVKDPEIKKMISLQLVGKIPYSLDDIIYDFRIIKKEKTGFSKVLVFIVHKEIVGMYLHLAKSQGVDLHKITVSSVGLEGWLNYQDIKNKKYASGAVVLINVDYLHTEICFFVEKTLVYTRNVNFGSRDMRENPEGLLDQLTLSLTSYKNEQLGDPINKIIIVSCGSEVDFLKEEISRKLRIDVEIRYFFENVTVSKKIDEKNFKDLQGCCLAAPIGILFGTKDNVMNFTPKEVFEVKKTQDTKKSIFVLAILIFLVMFTLSGFLFLDMEKGNNEVKYLKEKLKELKPEINQINEKRELVDFLSDKISNRVILLEVVDELNSNTPDGISFKTLKFQSDSVFVISGFAKSRDLVNSFQDNLVKAGMFEKVQLKFATQRKIFNTDLIDFQITTSIVKK